jgi:hypothetical protein
MTKQELAQLSQSRLASDYEQYSAYLYRQYIATKRISPDVAQQALEESAQYSQLAQIVAGFPTKAEFCVWKHIAFADQLQTPQSAQLSLF